MPLTSGQINIIDGLLNGTSDDSDHSINGYINDIVSARDDAIALLRIHDEIPSNSVCLDILDFCKSGALAASQNLIGLLS